MDWADLDWDDFHEMEPANLNLWQIYLIKSWRRANHLLDEWSGDFRSFVATIKIWKRRHMFYEKTYDDETKKLTIQPNIKPMLLNYLQDLSRRLFEFGKLFEMLRDNSPHRDENNSFAEECRFHHIPLNILDLVEEWKQMGSTINLVAFTQKGDNFPEETVEGAIAIAQKWLSDQEERKGKAVSKTTLSVGARGPAPIRPNAVSPTILVPFSEEWKKWVTLQMKTACNVVYRRFIQWQNGVQALCELDPAKAARCKVHLAKQKNEAVTVFKTAVIKFGQTVLREWMATHHSPAASDIQKLVLDIAREEWEKTSLPSDDNLWENNNGVDVGLVNPYLVMVGL